MTYRTMGYQDEEGEFRCPFCDAYVGECNHLCEYCPDGCRTCGKSDCQCEEHRY